MFLFLCRLLFCLNSTGAISIARPLVKHEQTKHIGVDAYLTWVTYSEWCCCSSVCAFRAPVGRFFHESLDSRPTLVLSLQTQCS
jgi:hypothetical protein